MVVFYCIARKEVLGNGNHMFFREIKSEIGFIKFCNILFPKHCLHMSTKHDMKYDTLETHTH